MAKLYFKYGAMGSSKTAQALITKFNYEERGMSVWLIKPSTDDRDGAAVIRSRIGLGAEAEVISPGDDIRAIFDAKGRRDVIIADECQFLTPAQIEQLRQLVDEENVPVLCFGLRTDFQTHLFPGSARLFELADSITEIKTICECGSKATVNARIGPDGKVVTEGEQVLLGGNDTYIAMCHSCWRKRIDRENKIPVNQERRKRIMATPTPISTPNPEDFAKTVLMPGDPLRSKFIAEKYLEDRRLVNNVRGVQGYTGTYKGVPVSVMASGMGMPSIGIYSYELFNFFGVENILRVGSAGAISMKLKVRDIVLGQGACTNSAFGDQFGLRGTSPPSRTSVCCGPPPTSPMSWAFATPLVISSPATPSMTMTRTPTPSG